MRHLTYTERSAPTADHAERPWIVLLHLGPIVFLIPCEWPKLHTNEPTKERTTNA